MKLPELKRGTSIDSLGVIAWTHKLNEQTKTVIIGLALQQGVGCSPFCGCAANQILQLLEPELRIKFPELQHFRIYSLATIPPKEIENQWKQP
ncbi:MAG: hypothetical protein AAB611_01825 [Patescibacteria group bacterium]